MSVSGISRVAAALLAATAILVCTPPPAIAVNPPSGNSDQVCGQARQPNQAVQDLPWAQAMYAAPDELWPLSRGAGTTVAVVATGVDSTHPQLDGKVNAGFDFLRGIPEGGVDCAIQGTAMAGIITAGQKSGIGFYGLAPGARILPIRVATAAQLVPESGDKVTTPEQLAAGIDYAVSQKASVILVGEVVFGNSPVLADSVSRAISAGIVVIAPVGDAHPTEKPYRDEPTPAELTPYPAAYPDVIGVGAVNQDLQRAETSEIGKYTDLMAPGVGVVSTGVVGQAVVTGSCYAAAFVAAAAALTMAQSPTKFAGETGRAYAVAVGRRLTATASPLSGHLTDLAYGAGILDPSRALSETLTAKSPTSPRVPQRYSQSATEQAAERTANQDQSLSFIIFGIAALALVSFGLVAFGVRRLRRRGTLVPLEQSAVQVDAERDKELEYVAGDKLFAAPDIP